MGLSLFFMLVSIEISGYGAPMGRVFPLDQDPFDPEAVPAMQFGSIFTGQRVTVEAE